MSSYQVFVLQISDGSNDWNQDLFVSIKIKEHKTEFITLSVDHRFFISVKIFLCYKDIL